MSIELGHRPGIQMVSNRFESVSDPKELYDQVCLKSYSITEAAHPGIVVTPRSKYCWFVNDEAAKVLGQNGYHGAYLKKERQDGEILHAFIAVDEPKKALVDYQYQQFLAEEDITDDLPKYLHIPYTNKADVIAGLTRHRIPEKYHDYWLDELDWTGRFPNLLISPLYASSVRPPDRTF